MKTESRFGVILCLIAIIVLMGVTAVQEYQIYRMKTDLQFLEDVVVSMIVYDDPTMALTGVSSSGGD